MSEIINKFNIFRDLPPNLMQNIKTFYVSEYFGYCVLNDNKVYGLGEGIHEKLGYRESEEKYVLITEFNDKIIKEFYKGHHFCKFGRNNKNEIFSWGWNDCGQLARGYESKSGEYLRPEKIDFFDEKNIIEVSCGWNHCLALSSDGRVFGWGNNAVGSVGCGTEGKGKIISTPIEIKLKNKIKFIHCTSYSSFAVGFDGNFYYWGLIDERDQIYNIEESFKIKYIINYSDDSLYLLSFEGIIYEFSEQETNLKILCDIKEIEKQYEIIDLYVDSDKRVIFETQESLHIYHNSKVEKMSYKTLFEYFLIEFQITYKTIHLKESQLFVCDIENEENSAILIERHKTIYSNENNFKQIFNLNKFRISKDLPQILESNVKYYYESGENTTYFGLFVMNDNRVYCLGYNGNGKLGLGHNEKIYQYTEIIEFKDKNFQQFYQGLTCMFARSDNNEIFSWGRNDYGQLARGLINDLWKYFRPAKISFFDEKNIIEISCGERHYLALSSDGRVFGWGNNREGQVGCGRGKGDTILTPIEIEFKEKIKFIHCMREKELSFAVSFDGNSYYWGEIDIESRIFTPKLIALKNVFKIYYFYSSGACIILSNYGKIFEFYPKNAKIIEIKSELNFNDFYIQDNGYLLQSEESVYELKKGKLFKTNFINFFDFYYQKSRYYNKTIEISKDGYLMEKQINFNEKEKILILIDKYVFDRKYQSNFEEIEEKGRGRFGTVYEVKKKSNKVRYAIKMMEIQSKRFNKLEIIDELNLNEIKIMSELNSNFVVQYIDSWIEGQMIFGKMKRYLFIQMDLCEHNLKQFIDLMNETFDQKFLTFYYFISSELFKELIQCLDYLHSLSPPIIHRDLKPENVLFSDGINGRFLKLCDFGLAKIHEKSNHTRGQGTFKYMAPEVRDSAFYNVKSDIYSLALIATEIFRFEDNVIEIRDHKNVKDFDKYLSKYLNSILENHFKEILKTLSKCLLQKDYHLRSDCKQLLESIKEVTIDINIILNDEKLIEFESSLDKPKNLFLQKIFDKKLTKNAK